MLLAGESSEQVQRLVMVDLPGTLPFQALARSLVERIVHLLHLPVVDIVEALALRKPVPEKTVGVLIGPPLPEMVGMAEVYGSPQRLLQLLCI